jgi:hypothetical protein
MNKTEERFAEQLEIRKVAGELIEWRFEEITLKVAADTRYTADFVILHNDLTIELVDAKGGGPMDEKSRVKIKVAADKFWFFRFSIAKARTKKDGGGFLVEEF